MLLKIKPEKIVSLFENFAQFIDEAIITIDENGLKSCYPDRAMVCVISIEIPKSDFELFEFDKKRKIGLGITDFVTILKRGSKDETITFDIKDKNMEITFDTIRKFTVPYLNLYDEEVPTISDLKFTSSFRIKSKILKTAIEDGLIIGDNLDIKTEEEKLTFLTSGDVKSVESEVMKANLEILTGKAKARYSLDYLKKLKFDTEIVDIQFGKDYPMKISWGNCFVVLAPRVSEEEGE
jgi:DNA polymerase III sliding clamp (beta) subunit (PCNA family)